MRRRRKTPRVIVYVVAACARCSSLLNFLESRKIAFGMKDVIEDERAMRELALLTGGRAPVPAVLVGKKLLLSPDGRILGRALAARGVKPGAGKGRKLPRKKRVQQ